MWISQKDENQGRQEDHQSPTSLWKKEADHSVRRPFPKTARILHRSHFKSVMKCGSRAVSDWIAINYRLGRSQRPRLGITVSRRHGKAHDRNRFKRVVREAFRELYPQLPPSLEVNISPRRSSPALSKKIILNELLEFLKKYCVQPDCVNLDSARQSQIEALRSDRRSPSPSGKGKDEDRFGKVAASPNSQNLAGRSI